MSASRQHDLERPPTAPPEYPRNAVWDALREVGDPELGVSLVDMGMIVAADLAGGAARVRLTYTSMGCPASEMIDADIRARLLAVPGVERVEIEIVWDPIWTTARLTEDARDALSLLGVSV